MIVLTGKPTKGSCGLAISINSHKKLNKTESAAVELYMFSLFQKGPLSLFYE